MKNTGARRSRRCAATWSRIPGVPLGFIENSDDPADKQGWCHACELVFDQEQDRTPRFRAFCQHVVVCSRSYDDIKARHDFDASGPGSSGAA